VLRTCPDWHRLWCIAGLDAPADLRDDISRMVQATNAATNGIAKDPAGYLRETQAGGENPYTEAAAMAHDAGLDSCIPNL
jgi:hypothetical protein